jgi:hypothetical protein
MEILCQTNTQGRFCRQTLVGTLCSRNRSTLTVLLSSIIIQVANDRFGRQNTMARVLMRKALSTDALDERPNSWPAPPGGFSSTKVLGPDSDLRKEGRKTKRQRGVKSSKESSSSRDNNNAMANDEYDGSGEHPLLSRGLSSGRGGFSVEDLEKERASKRAKQNES